MLDERIHLNEIMSSMKIVLLIVSFLHFTRSDRFSNCIPNTSCQCYLTTHAFTFLNCSQTLTDLPIFHSQNIVNVTRIVARNAFREWPLQLCKYKNVQILDLSGSNFHSSILNFSCLTRLIHLNLSQTQLTRLPEFHRNISNYLQILDLSNNQLKQIDARHFQPLTNLISLSLQNNPIESINNIEQFFLHPHLESINLISSTTRNVVVQPSISTDQWAFIVQRWRNSPKSFLLRIGNVPFQTLISSIHDFVPETKRFILKMFLNSTFLTQSNTPICQCPDLRMHQRLFSSIESMKKYSSPLFQSTMCLMKDGLTHARLFDRRTYLDLHCPLLGKKSFLGFLPRPSTAPQLVARQIVFYAIFFLLSNLLQ